MSLSYDVVVKALALSNDPVRNVESKEAEDQLNRWETEKGFFYLLQDIYLKTELPLQIRWLAVICFKNGIKKYWRSSKKNCIDKHEKELIKGRLLSLLHEQNKPLTIQNAYAIAQIVRLEYPHEWSDIFVKMIQLLEKSVFDSLDLVTTNNLLLILNQVIKIISSVRIGKARAAMTDDSAMIIPCLVRVYMKFFAEWTNTLDLGSIEVCYLSLKNLRRIVSECFVSSQDHAITEFLGITVEHLRGLIIGHDKYSFDAIQRYVKCYCKLYIALINNNPTNFILLPSAENIISTFLTLLDSKAETIFNATEENDFWEMVALKGLIILKKIITYIYKKGAITLKQRDSKEEISDAIDKLTSSLFSKDSIQHLCDLIINWYLILRPNDVESWQLEPEEWCNEELNSNWEFHVRSCAEVFFQDLIRDFKENLSLFVLSKISNELSLGNSTENILKRDSILCTFQLSSYSIADDVNFDQLLRDILIPEALRNSHTEYKILRRRLCLIISEWLPVKCSRDSRKLIYAFLKNLLIPDDKLNDIVVKITAVQTLRAAIEDWDFNKHDFRPFLSDFVALNLSLLSSVSQAESKLYILSTISALIEKNNPLLSPEVLKSILDAVSGCWGSTFTENEIILQNALLRVLKNLVIALNEHSDQTYAVSIPLIKECCNEKSEHYTLLSEDGHELWLAIVQYCPVSVDVREVLNLFPLTLYGLSNSTEILVVILSIVRSYALLSPSIFTTESGFQIFKILGEYLPSMRDDIFAVFVSFMDILILSLGDNEKFLELLVSSDLLLQKVKYVLDPSQSIYNCNKVLLLFSRLAYASPLLFLRMLDHLNVKEAKFYETWFQYYSSNGSPRFKKINIMAFISLASHLVPGGNPTWNSNFPQIIKNILLFLEEVNETENGECSSYSHDSTYEDIDDYSYLDPHIKPHGEKLRFQNVVESADPVNTSNLKQLLFQLVHSLKSSIDETSLSQLFSSNDEYTNEKLMVYFS